MSIVEAPIVQAQEVTVQLPPHVTTLIDNAETELRGYAQTDRDQCSGYFPGFSSDIHLVDSIAFARALPEITIGDMTVAFNFLRYSAQPQPRLHGLHLDSDAATAVTGPSIAEQQDRAIWRLLLNLHSEYFRSVCVVTNVPVTDLDCSYTNGYLAVVGGVSDQDIQLITLPPRVGRDVSGLLFCANQVPHMGSDGAEGHFVAGYGVELVR